MKLPTRLAVSLTTAITALMALSAEVKMSHPAHVGAVIVGGFILGLIVHPSEGGTLPSAGQLDATLPPADGSGQKPAPEPL